MSLEATLVYLLVYEILPSGACGKVNGPSDHVSSFLAEVSHTNKFVMTTDRSIKRSSEFDFFHTCRSVHLNSRRHSAMGWRFPLLRYDHH